MFSVSSGQSVLAQCKCQPIPSACQFMSLWLSRSRSCALCRLLLRLPPVSLALPPAPALPPCKHQALTPSPKPLWRGTGILCWCNNLSLHAEQVYSSNWAQRLWRDQPTRSAYGTAFMETTMASGQGALTWWPSSSIFFILHGHAGQSGDYVALQLCGQGPDGRDTKVMDQSSNRFSALLPCPPAWRRGMSPRVPVVARGMLSTAAWVVGAVEGQPVEQVR